MRIAYLVSSYPAVSHTFIRREIEALLGMPFPCARTPQMAGALGAALIAADRGD